VAEREPIISCRNVTKRFGDQVVLHDFNLDIYPGETMVIMGGSGSGKSTCLRLMIGSLRPEEGEIWMFGQDLTSLDERGMNEARKKFGILFQSGALFNSMTVAENVALPLEEHTDLDPEIIDIQVKIKLELVGLREHAEKLPGPDLGRHEEARRAGPRPGARPARALLRRALGGAGPRDQRPDRPAHHRT
jgi:phospholipid/cholesterol/gamma-HCH transport system ATP-binding protein